MGRRRFLERAALSPEAQFAARVRFFVVLYVVVGVAYVVLGVLSLVMDGPNALGIAFVVLGPFWLGLVVRFLIRNRRTLHLGPARSFAGDARPDLRGGHGVGHRHMATRVRTRRLQG